MKEPGIHIDDLVSMFFDTFDNRGGRVPDYDVFRLAFAEGAVIGKRSSDGVELWSLREFWEPRSALLTSGKLMDFHEWETESTTTILDGVAVRSCTYQKEGLLDGLPYRGEGTKCFQFALTRGGWCITHVLWEDRE